MALYLVGLALLIGWDFAFTFRATRSYYELNVAAVLFVIGMLVTAGFGSAPMRKIKVMIGIIALSIAIEVVLIPAAWGPRVPMWAEVALIAWVLICSVAGLAYTLWGGRAGRAFFLLWGLQLVLMISVLDISDAKWLGFGGVSAGLIARSMCILAAALLIGRATRLGVFSRRSRALPPPTAET
jgi:hypothetical protein